jgi:hypothetical protein
MDPGPFFKIAVRNILTPNNRLLTLKTSVGDPCHFGADPDRTLDSTTFLSDFNDAKKIIFSYFFLITYPQSHYLQS